MAPGMLDGYEVERPGKLMPITVRVREACRLTGIGRSKLYELIAAGEIDIIKVGSITLVPVAALERFLGCKAAHLSLPMLQDTDGSCVVRSGTSIS